MINFEHINIKNSSILILNFIMYCKFIIVIILSINYLLNLKEMNKWGLGIGDWGLGIGVLGVGGWGQNPTTNTQNPNQQTQKK